MDTAVVYVRTAKGQGVFEKEMSTLSPAQRTTLILVDGVRAAQQIARTVDSIGNGYGLLAQLVDLGYISPVVMTAHAASAKINTRMRASDNARMAEVREYATKAVSTQLGPMADRVCIALEHAQNLTALESALETARMVMSEYLGEARAKAFDAHVQYLLNGARAGIAA